MGVGWLRSDTFLTQEYNSYIIYGGDITNIKLQLIQASPCYHPYLNSIQLWGTCLTESCSAAGDLAALQGNDEPVERAVWGGRRNSSANPAFMSVKSKYSTLKKQTKIGKETKQKQ